MRWLTLGMLLLAGPAFAQPAAPGAPGSPAASTGASATAPHRMVAAANPLAAEAGMRILREGGNVVDAAVAVQMVLTLVEPQSSGIGGGAVMLVWDNIAHQMHAWDGRETAPAAAGGDLFLRNGEPVPFLDAVLSGRSVGVPGTVRMLEAAHKAHGRLPWAQLIAPAIALAENGFPVSRRLAGEIAVDADRLRANPAARAYFFLPDGRPLPEGFKRTNPALAATLRAVAAQGGDAINRGPVAADITLAVRSAGTPGLMTTDDLAGYQAKRRQPVCAPYRVWRVCGFPPPSSGGITVRQILGLLEHFDMEALEPQGLDAAHLIAEAERLAYADRNRFLGDSDFVRMPVAGLIDRGYLAVRAQLIDLNRAITAPRAGNPLWAQPEPELAPQPAQPEHGTSQISIVDGDGNIVSMTTTIEDTFGSRTMVRGFMLNNELTDFSFRPEIDGRPVANRVEGGKRPRSSMSPTIVFDANNKPVLVIGSPGGGRIIGYVAQALVALLDWKLDPAAALALPHVLSTGDTVELESGTTAAALAPGLQSRGFPVAVRGLTSGLEAIRIGPDGLTGAADPRGEGVAVGD